MPTRPVKPRRRREQRRKEVPTRTADRADEQRLVRAWKAFGATDEAQGILSDVCRDVIDKKGYDVAVRAYEVVREHVTNYNVFRTPQAHIDELRDLVKDASALSKRIKFDLRALERLHARAACRKWYSRQIVDGIIGGPALRSWHRYQRAYARTVKILEADPCLRFLTTTAFKLPGRGNPQKRRNSDLIRALKTGGTTAHQIDAIIYALGWKTR